MSANKHWEQNKDATVYVGNLDERFGEALMWELMTQMGPVMNVHMPMDRVSRTHQGYGFVEFNTAESAEYAAKLLNGVRVYGKPVRVNKASADRGGPGAGRGGAGAGGGESIGAELFVNNLDPQVDEKVLYDTFSSFGRLVSPPNVVRDPASSASKGYGFVSYDSFEASDAAKETMNGQYVLSRQITVEYAYKKDGKGERHGDEAERKLASEGKKHNIVPEAQPLPPAYLMRGPQAAPAANSVAPPPLSGANAISAAPPGFGHNGPPNGAPPGFGGGGGGGGGHRGPSPAFHGGGGGRGAGGGGGGGPGALPLPPAPTGLPARPPPSQGGFGGPAQPHFRGNGPTPPPMGGAPGHPGGGFPPPPGFGGMPNGPGGPPMPPPGGFMPPPGFGPPPGR